MALRIGCNMQASGDPLADLRGLHLPPDPGFWPLAPGWWLLLAMLILLGVACVWLWHRHQQRSRPHPALAEMARLQVRAQSLDDRALIAQWSALLRRVAMQQHGPQAAGLAGEAWAQHLAAHAPADHEAGDAEVWAALGTGRYAPSPQIKSRERLVAHCRAWVEHVAGQERNNAHA